MSTNFATLHPIADESFRKMIHLDAEQYSETGKFTNLDFCKVATQENSKAQRLALDLGRIYLPGQ
jgi:hypothetical protein